MDDIITTTGNTGVSQLLARANWRLSRAGWALVGLTLVGAVLRVYLLADKSIWLDEAFSIALSQHELDELLRLVVLTDAHPPLYYVVLKYWTLLGTGEGVVRLLSAIFSTAAIPLMYLLGVALHEERGAGLLAATILAFSPFHIWYAQEARMYAMLTFFVLASAIFLVKALRENRVRDWGAYAVTTALALYTDNGAIWYVVAVGLFSGYWVWRVNGTPMAPVSKIQGRHQQNQLPFLRSEGRARKWLLSHGAILLLYGPWLPFLARQTQQVTESFWLLPPSFQAVLETFLDFNSFNFPWMALSVLYVTALLVWAYLTPNGGWQQRLATAWLFVPLVISLLLSLRQPIFLSRNLIAASLGFTLLVVDTIRKFDSPRAAIALLAPLLLMNVVSIGMNAWVEEKEDWRALVAHVAASVERRQGVEDSLILFVPSYAELPFAYYFEEEGLAVETQGYPQDELLLHAEPQEVESLEGLLAERSVVWLVLRDVETVDPDWEVKAWLDSNGYVGGPQFDGDEVSALSYIRWDLVRDGAPAAPGTSLEDAASLTEDAAPLSGEETFSTFVPLLRSEPGVAPTPSPVVHVIAPGDTLWNLARDYGTSVQAIMEANGIGNANRLRVGQELLIPVPEE